jgi:hypothetical protein
VTPPVHNEWRTTLSRTKSLGSVEYLRAMARWKIGALARPEHLAGYPAGEDSGQLPAQVERIPDAALSP